MQEAEIEIMKLIINMLDFKKFSSVYYSKIIIHNFSFIVDKVYIIKYSLYFIDIYLQVVL